MSRPICILGFPRLYLHRGVHYGCMQRKIEVLPYDPGWVSEFEIEGKRISGALGDTMSRLHHIGSTAIPGISAKPIIDFLLEVYDIVELDEKDSAL